MEIALLLLLPILIALTGFIISAVKNNQRYSITFKEFLALLGAVSAVVTIGYLISRYAGIYDEELWNGRIAKKQQERVSCSHSYPCNPYPCGDSKHPSTCWHTCYEHTNDWDWALYSTNNERIEIARVDRRGSNEPPRFTRAQINDPTAVVHSCKNYIKANPWTLLRRQGMVEKFKNQIPSYPIKIYDYHYVNRLVDVTGKIPAHEAALWNQDLMDINATLGKKKEINIVLVVVPTSDSAYLHALEEAWLGGKKNDLVVILGVSAYPKIDWARAMSWTRAEELKIMLRDQLQQIGTLEKRTEIVKTVSVLADELFVRTKMSEFKYLMAGVRPPIWALAILFVIGTGLSIALTLYFWNNDPFGSRNY
ncbi:MAG: hypothetical protein Q8P76_00150 [bacterium]|nr:hypothetical protein [bacterium]